MSKLENIEDKINTFLRKSGLFILKQIYRAIPQNVKILYKKLKTFKEKIYKRISGFFKRLIYIIYHAREYFVRFLNKQINNFKLLSSNIQKIKKDKNKIKKFLVHDLKSMLIAKVKEKKQYLSTKYTKKFNWIFIGSLVMILICSAGGVYYYSYKLYSSAYKGDKASLILQKNIRPNYYKQEEKSFTVYSISLPLYIESVFDKHKKNNIMKRIKIDITVVASNRYIKAFFFEHLYYIHNAINDNMEPIAVDFPIKNEGKIIIKRKLIKIIDNLLKKLKIKGTIKAVYINSQLGG